MLFGWLVPTTVVDSHSTKKLSAIDTRYVLDQRFKRSSSNILKLYSQLINKCSSGKNIAKLKSLLGELQQQLIEHRQCRLGLMDDEIGSDICEQIECLEMELLGFTKQWIVVSKSNFEFMRFLVGLERIGDNIRLLFKAEDELLQEYPLAKAG